MAQLQKLQGYLVVLEEQDYPEWVVTPSNPRYKGIFRVPAAPIPGDVPEVAEEAVALDAYVFGQFKDPDTGLIPTYDLAVQLLQMFSRSPRRYEIVFCCADAADTRTVSSEEFSLEPLGYDVAVVPGDYWSIVDDIPDAPWVRRFRDRLNMHGLFSERADAEEYLQQYRAMREHDWDMDFRILYVARVLPGQHAQP